MFHQLLGSGLPNVFLRSGFKIRGEGDLATVAYADIDGLYRAIGLAISHRGIALTGEEVRFLRKRLGKSQAELGELIGKGAQTVAKWEKNVVPTPLADSIVIRLVWVHEFDRTAVRRAVAELVKPRPFVRCDYVFAFEEGRWVCVSDEYPVEPPTEAASIPSMHFAAVTP